MNFDLVFDFILLWNVPQPYSGWAFLGLLTDEGGEVKSKNAPLPKICNTYPTMMKL